MKKKYPIVKVKKIKPWFYKRCQICNQLFKKESGYKRDIITLQDTFYGLFLKNSEFITVDYFCNECYDDFESSILSGSIRI